ncbi:MAG: DUF1254 domain-containing protein [Kangiellaceae bacterium]|nr:DUF1254 domain-containing protein [Kangiellaceae bacterium]
MYKSIFLAVVILSSHPLLADKIKVTLDNYELAESDLAFSRIVKRVGSNAWFYFPGLTPIDHQTVVRMNRDTVYSAYIADVSQGATVTLPKTKDGRYLSVMVVQNDHYIDQVFTKPGTYDIKSSNSFVRIAARIEMNPFDSKDMVNVKRSQQQIFVNNSSKKPYPVLNYDKDQLFAMREKLVLEGSKIGSLKNMQGARGAVTPQMHLFGTALGWGLLPDLYAQYLSYYSQGEFSDANKCYAANYKKPPMKEKGFFSITVYNQQGWMTSEDSVLNDLNIDYNKDGTFTVHYGNCDASLPNRLRVDNNWDMLFRIYEPRLMETEKYSLPKITIVQNKG